MFTSLALGSALVSGSLAALLPASPVVSGSNAVITPGPNFELLRKQNDIRYMGWVSYSEGWTSEICDVGNTYYQGGGQWACCTTTKAGCQNLPVSCFNGDLIYRATASSGSGLISNSFITRPCASTDRSFSLCNSALMFENDRDSSPKVNIVCGVSSANWSYYRQAPSAATAISSKAGPTSIAAIPSPNRASPTPTSTSTPTLLSSSDTDTSSSSSSKKSKAWIAGAVIGPLVGLALIGLAAFFLIRRKKNAGHNQEFVPATGSMPPAGATAYQANQAQGPYPNNPASPQPPQYYPNMQQNVAAAPLGVKQDGYYGNNGPQGPQGPQSPVSPYSGAQQQQWQQQPQQQPGAGQPVYNNVPSPSMSPSPQQLHAAPAPYVAEARPFSSELEGSVGHGQAEVVSVQPKR
ncbi:hypothetical protein DE146DRAFT_636700 [Phaeosphaeria sp. MPI-PUGE-AT-0046c]|nr:hypothetical protein DE146DRAFT_636700 [Phaeosphaeria sp. MPI-PUGE-AT-0046c]